MAEVHRKKLRYVLEKLQLELSTADGQTARYVEHIFEDKILNADNSVVETRRIQEPTILWNQTKEQLIMRYSAQDDDISLTEANKRAAYVAQLQNEE